MMENIAPGFILSRTRTGWCHNWQANTRPEEGTEEISCSLPAFHQPYSSFGWHGCSNPRANTRIFV